ncbi:MAG: hypothetical protein ACE5F5_09525 [Acidimicrobiia bacterium]
MPWWLLLLLLGWSAVPSFLLMGDRILDVRSHDVLRRLGVVYVIATAALIGASAAVEPGYVELVAWGALAGLLGTITLDIVRLIGLKLGAFPLDMPVVFGFMALGKTRMLQANVMGQVLRDAVDTGTIKEFVSERLTRIPHLPERQRVNAAAAIMGAIGTLDPATKEQVSEAQFAALGSLSAPERQAVMAAMDAAVATSQPGQPRGLPRVRFQTFREAATRAFAVLDKTERRVMSQARLYGYIWHAVNGISFGIGYTLIFGRGSVGWALAWGVFVWLAMMVAMPAMMPVLELPNWFPIVPLAAHIAMVLPFFWLVGWVSDPAHQVSILGLLGG